jgi:signal transduction histidine kinase
MHHLHATDIVRLILCGAVLYLALHQIWLFLRDREERVYLWASGWCAAAATFLIGRSMLHWADTPSEADRAVRLVFAALFGLAPLGVGGVRAMLRRPRSTVYVAVMLAMLIPVGLILFTNLIVAPSPQHRSDVFGHTFWTANPGVLAPGIIVYLVGVGLYCLQLVLQARHYVDQTGRMAMALAGGFFIAAFVNDTLIARGVVNSLQAGEYAAAAVAFALSYSYVRRSSKYFDHIEEDGAMRSRLIEKVIEAQERERKRIARDLHDATGQSLTSLLVRLRALESADEVEPVRGQVAELRKLTKRALEEVRRIAQGLHPVALDDLGFEEAVRAYVEEFGASHGIGTDIHMNGLRTHGRLPSSVEIVLYRIAQEALNNVVKHAKASTASLIVDRDESQVRMIIEDDGEGFDAEATTGLGLLSIRERAALCDGGVTIESSPGSGTTLYVTIPLGPG